MTSMYDEWSVADHLHNIGLVLKTAWERGGQAVPIDLADALVQLDLVRRKLGMPAEEMKGDDGGSAKTSQPSTQAPQNEDQDEQKRSSAMMRLENVALWETAAKYKKRAAKAFSLGFLIGGAAGYWTGVLFGVTCPS
jgi:hypothetical protein